MEESVGKSETWILNPAEGYLIPKARGGVSLTPIYSFFEGGFSRERVKPSFLWHLALYHSFITFFWKLHWNSSSRSDDIKIFFSFLFLSMFWIFKPGLIRCKNQKRTRSFICLVFFRQKNMSARQSYQMRIYSNFRHKRSVPYKIILNAAKLETVPPSLCAWKLITLKILITFTKITIFYIFQQISAPVLTLNLVQIYLKW